ncbi:GGDEF domain-containing protein [Bradyrhizobium prioriisuperbiae]|uniref:GGDEF domain-containing protein n=1 Tax=Bradyrhizobium prioriisuperbiae TaxID=2854389 RepID=UPI0028EE03BD|nr:GGDEF domain-containing protein [Bradyrhizobium prioritasuperba]
MQLSVPTIQVVILANFFALAIVWFYVARSYPNLNAAKFWRASMCLAAAGAATAILRGIVHPLFPVILGNSLMILACCFAWAGIRQFYGRPAPMRLSAIITAVTAVMLGIFTVVHDDINIRLAILSAGNGIPLSLAIRDLRSRPEPAKSPGADLASLMLGCIVVMHVIRSACAFLGVGGQIAFVDFNAFQASAFLVLIFAGMMANFGFVLMAIDRLRSEVADLALVDELTGIANRRHFLARLTEECARADRNNEPCALLVIDLDGFKAINDGHGHGAGDECLRSFAHVTQAHLRNSDLVARTGGDEFCVILPSTGLCEATLIARNLLQVCRGTPGQWNGIEIPITASIGIAEWSRQMSSDPGKLIAAADQAVYAAKNQGRDRIAIHEETVDRLRQVA